MEFLIIILFCIALIFAHSLYLQNCEIKNLEKNIFNKQQHNEQKNKDVFVDKKGQVWMKVK